MPYSAVGVGLTDPGAPIVVIIMLKLEYYNLL